MRGDGGGKCEGAKDLSESRQEGGGGGVQGIILFLKQTKRAIPKNNICSRAKLQTSNS